MAMTIVLCWTNLTAETELEKHQDWLALSVGGTVDSSICANISLRELLAHPFPVVHRAEQLRHTLVHQICYEKKIMYKTWFHMDEISK